MGTRWGADPKVIRTSGLAICYSVGEYACPVWRQSSHTKKVDIALNDIIRLITGCLKPTSIDKVQILSGIVPPEIRREIAANIEKGKQINDDRHVMYGITSTRSRLKSRNYFMKTTSPLRETPMKSRTEAWKERARSNATNGWGILTESLPPGHNLPWKMWKTLNNLRTKVGRIKENLNRCEMTGNDWQCKL